MIQVTPNLLRAVAHTVVGQTADACTALGVVLEYAGGSYDSVKGTIKLTIKPLLDDREKSAAMKEEEREFSYLARLRGGEPKWFGALFSVRGRVYRVTGWHDRSARYPIEAARVPDGTRYRFTTDAVRNGLLQKEVE